VAKGLIQIMSRLIIIISLNPNKLIRELGNAGQGQIESNRYVSMVGKCIYLMLHVSVLEAIPEPR
jgi:hypothetical protein